MRRIQALCLLIFFVFFACSQSNSTNSYDKMAESPSYTEESATESEWQQNGTKEKGIEQTVGTDGLEIPERKIIRTADYKIQVEDVEKSTALIEDMVKSNGGFISKMNLTSNSYTINNQFIIRVQNNKFNELVKAISSQALFTNYKTINSLDVSEEFVDIEARLKTKREVRDRYVDILKNKAKTVAEVLNAEEMIRKLQEEIEAKEGRLRFLQNKVSLSTVNLDIYQKVSYTPQPDVYEDSFLADLKDGFMNGWSIVTGLLLVLVNLWPLVILLVLFVVFRKKLFARFKFRGK